MELQVVALELTAPEVGGPILVANLLDQSTTPFEIFIWDGAYDGHPVSEAVLDKPPDAQVIVPPRKTTAPSVVHQGQIAWQRVTGYNLRNHVKLAMQRHKGTFGNALKTCALVQQ